jgi:FkbM family methyltransferase
MNPLVRCGDRYSLETEARRHQQSASLGNGSLLCRVLGKYILYADVEDVAITPHLCLDGFWESWITFVVLRVVQAGWCCIDVGANFGYYTLLLADLVGPSGRVLAIEPNPAVARLLERSVLVNGFQDCTQILRSAATDCDGKKVTLAVPPGRSMNASLCRQPAGSDAAIAVPTMTIDEGTTSWPRVDFIKIDAEGAEEAIWRGMGKTLRRNPDISIVMEIRCARYENPRAFLASIRRAGFPLQCIDYDGAIREVGEDELMDDRRDADWTLFLHR